MTNNYKTIGQRIRRFRTERGITQEELAYRINTSAAYISCIETGRKHPSLEKLIEISEALNVTLNDLIYPCSHKSDIPAIDEIFEMLSQFTPDKRELLLKHLCAIIKSFTIK